MYEDPHPTRIDYLRYNDMMKINELVSHVWKFVVRNPKSDPESYIRDVLGSIERVYENYSEHGLDHGAAYAITLILRSVALSAKNNGEPNVVDATSTIIKIFKGENTMQNQNPLTVMTFRRVKEAIDRTINEDSTYDEVVAIADQCANKIVEDVFGGKQPAPLNLEQLEGRLYILVKEVAEWVRAHPEKDIVETVETFGGVIDALLGKGAKKGHSFLPDPSFVNKYYEIDPETEDVLHNGTLVIDDMKVLIESEAYRVEIKANMTEGELYKARERNRWAIVTESKVVGLNSLQFVALYDDGTKRKIVMDSNLAWIVKKDSIPRIDTILEVFLEGNTHRSYSGPTKKVVEILKGDLTREQWNRFRIQTGEDGDVLTLEEYMAIEDPQPEESPEDDEGALYDVLSPDAGLTFTGTAARVVEYLKSKSVELRQASNVFKHNDGRNFVSGADFLLSNEANRE